MRPYYFALITALVWGSVPIFEKMGLAKLSPHAGIFIRCLAVSSGALILFLFKPTIIQEIARTPIKNIALIVGAGLTANFVGQLLFYNALKHGEASKIVPIAGAFPLVTFLMGVLILGEKLTMTKSFGIGFVVLGIFLLR